MRSLPCERSSKALRGIPARRSSSRWSSILHRRCSVKFAFVAEFARSQARVRTLAYWGKGRIKENIEFDLDGTPCEDVVRGNLCHHPAGRPGEVPARSRPVELGIESYLGVPLVDGDGTCSGTWRFVTSGPCRRSRVGFSFFGSSPPARRSSSNG